MNEIRMLKTMKHQWKLKDFNLEERSPENSAPVLSILLNLIFRSNTVPVQIHAGFPPETVKLVPNVRRKAEMWNGQSTRLKGSPHHPSLPSRGNTAGARNRPTQGFWQRGKGDSTQNVRGWWPKHFHCMVVTWVCVYAYQNSEVYAKKDRFYCL